MRINVIFFLLFLGVSSAWAQERKPIEIGFTETIHSEILDEDREYYVHLPDEVLNNSTSNQNYPVAYVLDGESFFIPFVGHVKSLSSPAHMLIPKMIVIGIPNTNRWIDLSPTKTQPDLPYLTEAMANVGGGGDKFLDFIQKELIPQIEKEYPVLSHRLLVGHSLGGLLALHTFINRTNLFDDYLVLDPSVWWNDQYLIKQFEETAMDSRFNNKSLYVANANYITGYERKKGGEAEDYPEGSMEAKEKLTGILRNRFANRVALKIKDYPDENHITVVHIGQYDGMRFLYDYFNLPTFSPSSLQDFRNGFLKDYTEQFDNLSLHMASEIKPYEDQIMGMGSFLMSMNLYKDAKALFEMNTRNFPNSYQAWEALGDCYASQGKIEKARETYRHALTLNGNSRAAEKLRALDGK
ncbi:alpha/beta hydrolase-fold protein [Gramella sp. KN1008]|uniref:alpha/beta hydrolase-fold protein n=1 Tax=Gramella sp. KN1008 TaxID=2529298 RepID=UPI00103EF020|nr:alpha/beta hydrolase-fold protein [Gramella sp. KN1008]TBW30200.1 tetratricopeptide repeat protein [Gramella sp. KN1008]